MDCDDAMPNCHSGFDDTMQVDVAPGLKRKKIVKLFQWRKGPKNLNQIWPPPSPICHAPMYNASFTCVTHIQTPLPLTCVTSFVNVPKTQDLFLTILKRRKNRFETSLNQIVSSSFWFFGPSPAHTRTCAHLIGPSYLGLPKYVKKGHKICSKIKFQPKTVSSDRPNKCYNI